MENRESCPSCGVEVSAEFKYCPNCSYALIEDRMNRYEESLSIDEDRFALVSSRLGGLENRYEKLRNRLDIFISAKKIF